MPSPGSNSTSTNRKRALTLGTRGSALALWQAKAVQSALAALNDAPRVHLEIIKPEGDLDKESSLVQIGGRGVFSSALQVALLEGAIDLAVHSAKDVPTIAPVGLTLAAFPFREDAHDAVVSRHGVGLAGLPANPVIGTSSRRRAVQIRTLRPDAQIVDLRGNIDTRLRKAESDAYDAVILAAAGLTRMGWQDRITESLNFDVFVPSPGQGALAVETRIAPDPAAGMVARLNDPAIAWAVTLERLFLITMAGGCTTPIGAHAEIQDDIVRFWAMVGSDDCSRLVQTYEELPAGVAEAQVPEIARRLVRDLAPSWSGTGKSEQAPDDQPLAGRKVVVTGTSHLVASLREAFVAEGAPVLEAPTIAISPVSEPAKLASALQRAANGAYDWLVVTSQNSVPALAGTVVAESVRLAAIGEATKSALVAAGFDVDLVAEAATGEGLVEAIRATGDPIGRVLLLQGSSARTSVAEGLIATGAAVDRVETYVATPIDTIPDVVLQAIGSNAIDIVTFASPASVLAISRILGANLAAISGACLVAIGPTTETAMRELGLPVHAVAADQSVQGIVAACREYFLRRFGVDERAG